MCSMHSCTFAACQVQIEGGSSVLLQACEALSVFDELLEEADAQYALVYLTPFVAIVLCNTCPSWGYLTLQSSFSL